jgi:hypothetical protein
MKHKWQKTTRFWFLVQYSHSTKRFELNMSRRMYAIFFHMCMKGCFDYLLACKTKALDTVILISAKWLNWEYGEKSLIRNHLLAITLRDTWDSIFSFWTLSIILFLYLKQCFGDWILSQSSGKSLLSWTQSIELVPVSRQRQNPVSKTMWFK